jgi:hypothetical protein
MKKITYQLVKSFQPCYDPEELGIDITLELAPREFIEQFRDKINNDDILWILLRSEFLSDKDLRLFAVWCAREALKLVDNPDPQSVEACNVAEKYANGEVTKKELKRAQDAAGYAVQDIARYAAQYAARAAASSAAQYAARCAASSAAQYAASSTARCAAQIDQLLTYFK